MRILFVRPPLKMATLFGQKSEVLPGEDENALSFFYQFDQTPALEMVASCVPEHHEVCMLGLREESENVLEREITAYQPDVVGVTCLFTCATNATLRTVQRIRDAAPDVFIILGGHAPSLSPEYFDIEELDAIAIGEGEAILPPLLERLEQGREWRDLPGLAYRSGDVLHQPSSGLALVDDLDALPSVFQRRAAWAADPSPALPWQFESVFTSRGCPYRCSFCSVYRMYRGRYRCLSAERTVQEIERIPARFIGHLDANFMVDIPRVRSIARLLLERGVEKKHFWQSHTDSIVRYPDVIALWKQAGLSSVFVGFESADDQRLAGMHKSCTVDVNRQAVEVLRKYDITIWGGFIIEPDFTEEDFESLRCFAVENQIDIPFYSILTPYPGTDLWDQCYHELTTHDWDYFDTRHVVLPTRLPLEQFYQLCFELESDTVKTMRRLALIARARYRRASEGEL